MIPKSDLALNIQKPADAGSGGRWRLWAGLAILLLLLGGGVLGWAIFREDPNLAHARELREQMKNMKDMSPDQRKELFKDMRETMDQLSQHQKYSLEAPMQQKRSDEMKKFFALSPEEREKVLDERIDRMVEWRKKREEWQQQRQQQGDAQGGGAGPGGGGRGGPGAGGGGGPGGGGFGPPPGGGNANQRQKDRIDWSTADDRGMMQAYRELMRERMNQRGVGGGGGGPPRGP